MKEDQKRIGKKQLTLDRAWFVCIVRYILYIGRVNNFVYRRV